MKSKKGFTLVELLAVIAILAILVIIAIPNVLNLYRNARENVFRDDAQNVLRTAKQQYLQDSIGAEPVDCYSSFTGEKNLDLDAKSALKYLVKFDTEGNVSSINVKDKNYSISVSSDVKIDSLKTATISPATEGDLKCATE